MADPVVFEKDYIMSSESTDSVKVHKKGYRSPKGGNYQILRYDKDVLCYGDKKTGIFRSLIVNLNSKKIVVFSPVKSLNLSELNESNMVNIRAEEFVEGTMVNLFYDAELQSWDIATRSTVGGNVKFYRDVSKTFYMLFEEACVACGLNYEDNFNKDYCYSFVVQHPENRIVTPFEKPSLYLIASYCFNEIQEDDKTMLKVIGHDFNNDNLLNDNMKEVKTYLTNNTCVKFPEIYNETSHKKENYINQYASQNTDYKVVGVVFKQLDNPFIRYKCRNPNYEDVRRMRGNQSKGQYTYLELRKSGKMAKYLKLYPEDKKKFNVFREQVHNFTYALYNNYVRCYIKKEKPLGEWPKQYRIHMYAVHQKYLSDYVTQKKSISLTDVIFYFNELHPSQQMAMINYNFRKNEKDVERKKIIDSKEKEKTTEQ